jgi:death-on-curing protein
MTIKYLSIELVKIIHTDQIRRYGGSLGIRDHNLLQSAIAQSRITVGGKSAHKTIFDKAAAYGFHICRNHPFIDGNKRVAFVCMYIFLEKNGWTINTSEEDAYRMMIELAQGKYTRSKLSSWLKENSRRHIA